MLNNCIRNNLNNLQNKKDYCEIASTNQSSQNQYPVQANSSGLEDFKKKFKEQNCLTKYLDINWYNYTVYDSHGNQVGTTTLGDSNTNYVFYSDIKNDEYLKRGLDIGASLTGYIFMEVSSNDIASLNISKPDKN